MSPIPVGPTPGTFGPMRLRRLVDELVGADGSGAPAADPDGGPSRDALAEHGHGELDPTLFGEALVHYADTAPIEVADALSPIVMSSSAVPFDPDLDPVTASDDPPPDADDAMGEQESSDDDADVAREDVDPDAFDDAGRDPTEVDGTNDVRQPVPEPDEFGQGAQPTAGDGDPDGASVAHGDEHSGPAPDESEVDIADLDAFEPLDPLATSPWEADESPDDVDRLDDLGDGAADDLDDLDDLMGD